MDVGNQFQSKYVIPLEEVLRGLQTSHDSLTDGRPTRSKRKITFNYKFRRPLVKRALHLFASEMLESHEECFLANDKKLMCKHSGKELYFET